MKTQKTLYYIAISGLTLGLIVHLTALIADYDLRQVVPFLWILHIGIFVVWIPMVLLLKGKDELQQFYNYYNFNQSEYFKIIFKNTPTWLKIIAFGGMGYAGLNFILFIVSQPGSPSIENGKYILSNHGQLISILTKKEYLHYLANETRGFSGHWIAFYGIASAVLYPSNEIIEE